MILMFYNKNKFARAVLTTPAKVTKLSLKLITTSDLVGKFFACLELRNFTLLNFDDIASLWVAAVTSSTF
jgi:hypothetical protein